MQGAQLQSIHVQQRGNAGVTIQGAELQACICMHSPPMGRKWILNV